MIFAEELVHSFLNNFCIAAFYMTMTSSEIQDKKAINRLLVSILDIFACRHKNLGLDDFFATIITENDHATKFACFMARAMYSFMLCHEIAHVALGHAGNDMLNEFHADALGYEIFYSAIINCDNLEYLEFFDGLRRAPLALFDIFDLVNYFNRTIHDKNDESDSHPDPILRKAALLNQFDFGDDEECFNLYLVISERTTALRYYIYKYRDVMKREIKKIHISDTE